MNRRKYMEVEKKKRKINELYGLAHAIMINNVDDAQMISYMAYLADIPDSDAKTQKEIYQIIMTDIKELEHDITEAHRKDGAADYVVEITGVRATDDHKSLVCKVRETLDVYEYPHPLKQAEWQERYYDDLMSEFISTGDDRGPDPEKISAILIVNGYVDDGTTDGTKS